MSEQRRSGTGTTPVPGPPGAIDHAVRREALAASELITLPQGLGGPGHAIVLMGAPGAGKSTVGAILSRRLGIEFIDVDVEIEHRVGKPIAEIFVDEGEPWFRALERDVTLELLERGGVISLGGGAVLHPDIRAGLVGHEVVWLKVSITQATRRVGMNHARPLLLGNVRSRLVALLQERIPMYEACATMAVDTDRLKARVVAREIIARLTGDAVEGTRAGDAVETAGTDDDLAVTVEEEALLVTDADELPAEPASTKVEGNR